MPKCCEIPSSPSRTATEEKTSAVAASMPLSPRMDGEIFFTVVPEDILVDIFCRADEDPRDLARFSCVCARFAAVIKASCWKFRCMRTLPPVLVADLLQNPNPVEKQLAEPPGGWGSLQKLFVCCPGLWHAGVLLESWDFGLDRVCGLSDPSINRPIVSSPMVTNLIGSSELASANSSTPCKVDNLSQSQCKDDAHAFVVPKHEDAHGECGFGTNTGARAGLRALHSIDSTVYFDSTSMTPYGQYGADEISKGQCMNDDHLFRLSMKVDANGDAHEILGMHAWDAFASSGIAQSSLEFHKALKSEDAWQGKCMVSDTSGLGNELQETMVISQIMPSAGLDTDASAESGRKRLVCEASAPLESIANDKLKFWPLRSTKHRRKYRHEPSHMATGSWNLSREQGNKLLANRFRADTLYICDWPGCLHRGEKRIYKLFRGVFKNFKTSHVWRNLKDMKAKDTYVGCAFCECKSTWDMVTTFCLKRSIEYHDDGEPVVRAYVCENGHVAGAWTDRPTYSL